MKDAAADRVAASSSYTGTVPLTSVYGKSVSTPAIPKASIGHIILRVNRDAGGSVNPWDPGHASVTTRK
ncbi:hypothetical protein NQZ68_029011 [Dissostichus eleginoides]|nr:hypothetical protein NQZ68_029011 [Dissostichus eleginoides]